jgi:hypothetical protein
MNVVGCTIPIVFTLRTGTTGQMTARVHAHRDPALCRLTLGPDDPGRIARRAIVLSCLTTDQPYRWPKN